MTFDALAMHAIKDELGPTSCGHIEKLFLLSSLEVGLRIRAQRRDYNLLISVDPQAARVHLVKGTLRRLPTRSRPFCYCCENMCATAVSHPSSSQP